MKPYNQFTSRLNNFRATLIDENLIGCDFIFNVYNLNTNLRVGQFDASCGTMRPTDTNATLSSNELKELASLCDKVQKECEIYQ